jgi:uncharacterized protein (TIGR00369 family)
MSTQPITLSQLRALVSGMPFNSLVGIKVARLHADGVTVEVPFREQLRNSAGVLHGGVTATLVDAAVGIAITRHFGGRRPATTVEMKINYFRPVDSGKITARSRLLRVGSTLIVGSVELRDGKAELAGAALVTYMLLPTAQR